MDVRPISFPKKHIAIIGGGITGLVCAYALQEKIRAAGLPLSFSLFESSPGLGGKISTERCGDFLVEAGPDSFLQQKPWGIELVQALGLEADLIGTNPQQKTVYILHRGRLAPMPAGMALVIPTRLTPLLASPLLSWPGKLRMGLEYFIPGRSEDADESVGDFIRRRFGREALEVIAEPLMGGIHVSDPDQQSLLGTFPRFREMEKQYGSLIRGARIQQRTAALQAKAIAALETAPAYRKSAFVTLRGGMGRLVDALAASLTDGQILASSPVDQIKPLLGGGYRITFGRGEVVEADVVVLATPANVSSAFVAPFSPTLSRALAQIRYVSTGVVSLAFPQSALEKFPDGIGVIIPRRENRRISACTLSSVKFSDRAPQNHLLLRCFLGGPGREETLERSDEEMAADARREVAELLNIRVEPELARVHRWIKANPQYDVGHLDKVAQIQTICSRIPGLFLAGSAYEGIGIPDCIHQGRQAAEKAMAFLTEPMTEWAVTE